MTHSAVGGTPAFAVADIGHDPDALEVFYRQHLEQVRGFIARRTADPETAADLTADVFLAAIDSSHRYEPDLGSPAGWLYGIARHVVANHHRSAYRRARATARFRAREWLDDEATEHLVARIDAERKARAVFEALADLPEGQRAVVELVAVDGLRLDEAAQALGISPTNARVRYHRARRRLTQTVPNIVEVIS